MRVVFHSVETHNSHLSALLPVGILVESELFFSFSATPTAYGSWKFGGGPGIESKPKLRLTTQLWQHQIC